MVIIVIIILLLTPVGSGDISSVGPFGFFLSAVTCVRTEQETRGGQNKGKWRDRGTEGVGVKGDSGKGLRLSRCSKSPSVLSSSRFASRGPPEDIVLLFLI